MNAKPKIRSSAGAKFQAFSNVLEDFGLNTVCTGSKCPNLWECWNRGVTAFMIMGSTCTRRCKFCAVKKGRKGEPLDPSEPLRVAEAAKNLGLRYVALTSVDRDDLEDGGAEHFANCIKAIRNKNNNVIIEVLIPDFQGDETHIRKIIEAMPDVAGHNIETVKEFQAVVRDRRAGYDLSLEVLRNLKRMSSSAYIKSSLMLGLGETEEMVLRTMDDLKNAGVEILTLGQYLRPSEKHLEVREYLSPEKFSYYRRKAEEKGFLLVVSGPLVRSSYMTDEFIQDVATVVGN